MEAIFSGFFIRLPIVIKKIDDDARSAQIRFSLNHLGNPDETIFSTEHLGREREKRSMGNQETSEFIILLVRKENYLKLDSPQIKLHPKISDPSQVDITWFCHPRTIEAMLK